MTSFCSEEAYSKGAARSGLESRKDGWEGPCLKQGIQITDEKNWLPSVHNKNTFLISTPIIWSSDQDYSLLQHPAYLVFRPRLLS